MVLDGFGEHRVLQMPFFRVEEVDSLLQPLICEGRKETTIIEKELGKISVHYWCAHSSMNICSLSVITHEENRTLLACTYGSYSAVHVRCEERHQSVHGLAITLVSKRLNAA